MSVFRVEFKHVSAGAIGGLLAGIVFGAMMGMMGMLPMVAMLAGGETALLGFFVHVVFSVVIGILFAIFFGHAAKDATRSLVWGLVYGVVWWILGPLVIMPLWLGMGLQLSSAGMQMALPSLWGHLVYGFILGLVFPLIVKKINSKD